MIRPALGLLLAGLLALAPVPGGNPAEARGIKREFREGMREIARERHNMRREIQRSGSRLEAERAWRRGLRGIERERWEMRREIRRRHAGRIVAGIVLGSVLRPPHAGHPPYPPSPELCWFWSDASWTRGYWYYCSGD